MPRKKKVTAKQAEKAVNKIQRTAGKYATKESGGRSALTHSRNEKAVQALRSTIGPRKLHKKSSKKKKK